MKSLSIIVFLLLITLGTMRGQEKRGTAADAQNMVRKAVEFIKANGESKAFSEYCKANGKFVEGDVYVFVQDMNGTCVANGGDTKLIGRNLINMKDPDGRPFVKERVELVNKKGKGWQNYKYVNPVTKAVEDKFTYVEKVGKYIIGSGVYKKLI